MTDSVKSKESWDHGSNKEFFEDYKEKSESKATYERFQKYYSIIDSLIDLENSNTQLDVADVGCGSGTQCRIWAKKGHRVTGLDVNGPLLELAKQRADDENLDIAFELGTATDLPWENNSKDICLVPELLEHVDDWQSCVNEFIRVLKPGGLLLMTTTNKLCPIQEEFNLPLYGWYPGFVKKYYERLSVTTKPELANFAKYPAVHWFSFYGLKAYLQERGVSQSFDRFDLIDQTDKSFVAKAVINSICKIRPLRWFAHVMTPYTFIVSIKDQPVNN